MSVLASLFGHPMIAAAVRIVGVSLLAGSVTAVAAFFFRARVRDTLPEGAALILGLGVVGLYLNTRLVLVQFIGNSGDPLTVGEAMLNVSVFVASGIASYGGRYVGNTAVTSNWISWDRLQPDFSPIVRAVGRFITVTLPEDIEDIEGYDGVDEETKATLAGRTLDFSRGLTVDELQSQLVTRLKEEYDIGYVDIDMAADGTVEYLAVGRRAAGIGPTLPPKSASVAVRADPPFSATPGDTVQLWRVDGDGNEESLGLAELRASVETVATVATDETVADGIDPTVDYRLMTLSADVRPDREFAAMLRRGDETMSVVEVTDGSPLVGNSVRALDVTIIAVRSPGGEVETIPDRDRAIRAGDSLFAIGRPDALRKLDASKGIEVAGDDVRSAAADGGLLGLGDSVDRGQRRREDTREDWMDDVME